MKVTRYFQSCLLVEEGSARVLIDPSGQEAERFEEFGAISAVFYTHEHSDHFDPKLAAKFMDSGAAVYANESTTSKMDTAATIVEDGQDLDLNGLSIKVYELPHCPMFDGSGGPQNTGYLLGGKLFHPGDGRNLDGLRAEILALPINGPDLSWRDAFDFAKQLAAQWIIPIHYDYLGGKPEVFASVGKGLLGADFHVLEAGQSAEAL